MPGMMKHLPQGLWLYVSAFPGETADAELVDWFCKNGLAITEDNISRRGNTAIISIPPEEVLALITWAMTRESFTGSQYPLRIERFAANSTKPIASRNHF
jgi:hypothetical protein